jgi:hypothetical protein
MVVFLSYRLTFAWLVKSVADPIYFFVIFTNSICTTNVLFLAIIGDINLYYFSVYFISEFAFLFGLLIFAKPQQKIQQLKINNIFIFRLKYGMIFTFFLALLASVIIYSERGIPLLLESRSDASGGGTGFGLFARLFQVSSSIFVLFYFAKSKITNSPNSFNEKGMFIFNILLGILSGFKAFFIFYLFAYFATRGRDGLPTRKNEFYVIFAGLILILITFSIVVDSVSPEEVLLALLMRLLASGDIYYMAFVDDTLDQLTSNGFFFQMFGSIFSSLRIIDWSNAPLNYGYAINEVVNKNDLNLGPTFRYNVLWIFLTKSIVVTAILSFMTGAVIGFSNRLLANSAKIDFGFIFKAFIYYKSFLFILGPDQAINDIFNSLLLFLLISIAILSFSPLKREKFIYKG